MPDPNELIVGIDSSDPRDTNRQHDLKYWDEAQGRRLAAEEGIEMTDAHWGVVYCLREYHLQEGPAENGRELGDMLADRYASQGGRKYLHRLFPEGPVRQAMTIAGLPIPPHTEDEGFGTSR